MVWGLLADAAPTQMTKKIIREARIGLKKLMETAIQFLLPLIPLSEEDAGEGSETRDHQLGLFTGTLTPRPSSNDDLSEAFSKILPETDNFPVDFQTSLMSTAMPSFKSPHRPKISSWGNTCLWLLREN